MSKHYLDLIISVGYRIKSHVATHFRQWATRLLREYFIKGFAMDAARLKKAGGGNYFEKLLGALQFQYANSIPASYWPKRKNIPKNPTGLFCVNLQ